MEKSNTRPILLSSHLRQDYSRYSNQTRFGNLVKRAVDLLVASAGLFFLSPFLLFIAVWIKRDSPGPVFYRGPRVGRGGKIFQILKFRTMVESAESYQGPRLTAQNDPRVTSVGRWLRDSKLNELTQLWNVIKGDMSLVGPRPEDPEIAMSWPEEIRQEVLSVRPGITSPASVLYRNEETMLTSGDLMDTYLGSILPSKLRLDQLYVRHRSLLLDLDILFWTSLVLIPKVGASAPPEEQLFLGPLSRLVRRYVRWFSIDAFVTLVAISITGIFWRYFGPLNVGLPKALGIAIGFSILYSLMGALLGVNRIAWSQAAITDAIDLVTPVGLATGIALVANYFWVAEYKLPPLLIVMAAILSYAGFVLARYRSRLLSSLAERWLNVRGGAVQAQERVLIVGGGETGEFAVWWLNNRRNHGVFRVVGFVDDDLYKQDTRIRGVHVLGRRDDIPLIVAKYDVGIILFAIHNIPDDERKSVLEICHKTPARVFVIPDILESLRNVTGNGHHDEKELPQTWESLSPDRIRHWLEQLDKLVENGDLIAIQKQIHSLHAEISTQSDALTQGEVLP